MKSYQDPRYDELDKQVEAKVGLPEGLLSSIRLNGEKSNADQVSEAGARSVYQIIPSTRKAAISKYGIDPYISPRNAAEVAGRLLKDSLDRNKGNITEAVGEYIGGTDRGNWGKTTKAYIQRVTDALIPSANAAETDNLDGITHTVATAPPDLMARVAAWKAAQANPQENSNRIPIEPKVPEPTTAVADNTASTIQTDTVPVDNTAINTSDPELIKRVAAWKAGQAQPATSTPASPAKDERGMFDKVSDIITGNDRKTVASETLPDWATMPELNSLSLASAKTGLGTMFSTPAETVAVIKHNFPSAQIRQDEKGNQIITSSLDGKDYVIPPGIRISDLPRVIGGLLAFAPSGYAATMLPKAGEGASMLSKLATFSPGMMAGSAATQAAIEGSQAATGGDFSAQDVAMAGALPGVIHALSKTGGALWERVKQYLPTSKPLPEVAENPLAAAVQAVDNQAATNATENISATLPEIPVTAKKPSQAEIDAYNKANPIQPGEITPEAPQAEIPIIAEAQPVLTDAELADAAKKAATSTFGKKEAQKNLAGVVDVNPEVKAAADKLGFDLEADQMTNNEQFRRLVGLSRSQAGSDAEARGIASIERSANKADEVMAQLDAGRDLSDISEKIKTSLTATRDDLIKQSDVLYDKVDNIIPSSTQVSVPNLTKLLDETVTKLGGENGLTKSEKGLLGLVKGEQPVTYFRLARERKSIGKAMSGLKSPYSELNDDTLKQLYGALAQDQHEVVKTIGGEVLGNDYKLANQLVAKRKDLEKRIIGAYGKDIDGSIVPALRNSIAASAKSDNKGLVKVLKVIPEPLQKEALASALLNLSTKNGKFGFNAYQSLYRDLRQNSQAYNTIVKALGPGSHDILDSLYKVSNGISKAQDALISTGRANKGFIDSLSGADNLVGKIMEQAKHAAVRGAVGEAATSAAIGPTGAGFMFGATNALMNGKSEVAKAVGDVLTSPEFKALVENAATNKKVNPLLVKRLSYSTKLKKYGKLVGGELGKSPKEVEGWLNTTIQANNNASN